MLQISVKDANDNRPIFEQSVYNATVRESLPIGSSIVTLRASDLDHDANGKVTYILESEGEENFFRIDANSGVISLRSALDRELRAQHVLNVIATGKFFLLTCRNFCSNGNRETCFSFQVEKKKVNCPKDIKIQMSNTYLSK